MAWIIGLTTEDKYNPNAFFVDLPKDWEELHVYHGKDPRYAGEAVRFGGHNRGLPIPDDFPVPRKVRIEKKWKRLPDFFSIQGSHGVSQAFKDLVEEFDPGRHQFFLLEPFRKDGGKIEGQYYYFNPGIMLDTAIIAEQSTVIEKGDYREHPNGRVLDTRYYVLSAGDPDNPNRLVLDKAVIADHHIWVDRRCKRTFFSDAFMAAIETRKLDQGFWRMRQTIDIDREDGGQT